MSACVYRWGNNEKRKTMKGRPCKVVARGRMNSVLIEFTDNGQREITSRYAVLTSDFRPDPKPVRKPKPKR